MYFQKMQFLGVFRPFFQRSLPWCTAKQCINFVRKRSRTSKLSQYCNSTNVYVTKNAVSTSTKGQLISNRLFGVIFRTKTTTKLFPGFLPKSLKRGGMEKMYQCFNSYSFLKIWKCLYFFESTSFQRLGQKSWKKFRWFFGPNDDTNKTF